MTGPDQRKLAEVVAGRSVELLGAGRSSTAWLAGTKVVRTPIRDSGRRTSSFSESLIGRLLPDELPVPRWEVVEVDGVACTIADRLRGRPIRLGEEWSDRLVADVARVLAATHRLATTATRWGPLDDVDDRLLGLSETVGDGVRARWFHAPIDPFDSEAAATNRAVVHSDLHPEHILVDSGGRLTGLLDFGDAFIGSAAWDIVAIGRYYGPRVADRITEHLPDPIVLRRSATILRGPWERYKRIKRSGELGGR